MEGEVTMVLLIKGKCEGEDTRQGFDVNAGYESIVECQW
jgi:hypothetical protein